GDTTVGNHSFESLLMGHFQKRLRIMGIVLNDQKNPIPRLNLGAIILESRRESFVQGQFSRGGTRGERRRGRRQPQFAACGPDGQLVLGGGYRQTSPPP